MSLLHLTPCNIHISPYPSVRNSGPGSPSGSTCNSACNAFIIEHCVFIGTNYACNVNAEIPVVTDDDREEGAESAPLTPVKPDSSMFDEDNVEEFGKDIRGTKGIGKIGHGKAGKKGEKSVNFGKGIEGKSIHDKYLHRGKMNKGKDAKGAKGGYQNHNSNDHERHLREIEYHRSQIDRLKKILTQAAV